MLCPIGPLCWRSHLRGPLRRSSFPPTPLLVRGYSPMTSGQGHLSCRKWSDSSPLWNQRDSPDDLGITFRVILPWSWRTAPGFCWGSWLGPGFMPLPSSLSKSCLATSSLSSSEQGFSFISFLDGWQGWWFFILYAITVCGFCSNMYVCVKHVN